MLAARVIYLSFGCESSFSSPRRLDNFVAQIPKNSMIDPFLLPFAGAVRCVCISNYNHIENYRTELISHLQNLAVQLFCRNSPPCRKPIGPWFISHFFRNDRPLVLAALRCGGHQVLCHASEELPLGLRRSGWLAGSVCVTGSTSVQRVVFPKSGGSYPPGCSPVNYDERGPEVVLIW